MRVIGAGDAIVTSRFVAGPGRNAISDLLHEADSSLVNLETPLLGTRPVPARIPRGMPLHSGAFVAAELAELGFEVVNLANNHAGDYSPAGVLATLRAVSESGLRPVGAGATLTEACAPAFVDTRGGRLAVIGVSSSNADLYAAADGRVDAAGRPGLNPLRYRIEYAVEEDAFEALLDIDRRLGLSAEAARRVTASARAVPAEPSHLAFGPTEFVRAQQFAVRTSCDLRDLDRTAAVIQSARADADAVVVTLHCHEGPRSGWNTNAPAQFAAEAARIWIDAGADAVIGHGPHCVRGVEVYRGKPIAYSLGNFAFQLNGVRSVPSESYLALGLDPTTATIDDYRAAVFARPDGTPAGFYASARFWDGLLADLEIQGGAVRLTLRPVRVGSGTRPDVLEQPALAGGERGRAVLNRVAALSAAWDTRLDIAPDGTYAVVC